MIKTKKISTIPEYGDVDDPVIRAKYGYLEATISIIGNTGLFLMKLFLGLYINSIALIADGVHSLSDVSTSGVVILGFRIAKKQPDKEHPYGHGRAEYIATLVIAVLLIIVGISFIQQSIERILTPEEIGHQEYLLLISGIVIISAIIKELMARYSNAIAQKINSDVLRADAWHHRSDSISSIGVAIGITAARYGYPILDPIFGIIVSIIVIYVGIKLVRTASNFLIGKAPDKETINQITAIANKTKGVNGVHDISIHDYGTTRIITLHAEVNNNLPLDQAHQIADELDKNIHNKTKCSTIIHLDPTQTYIQLNEKRKIIRAILEKQKEIKSFHKISIIQSGNKEDIKMHLVVDKDMSIDDSHEFCHVLTSIFEEKYGSCNVDIHFEPCIDNCKICTISCSKRNQ
jgi:cation diffusion facilitator family transporter